MKKVGRYDVIAELGRGAMGIVYKAADPTIGRQVALKVLTLDSGGADEGTHSPQEMFMREVRAAGRLAHPSIVTIHDAFEDAETKSSCIVMELVAGKTLESMLLSGQFMTVEQTLHIIRQVAEGLDYAHRNQVVHRDLKPANILVTEDRHIKITDFGIAKVLAREGVARTVGVMGTPSYMSPEQVKGGEIDGRTDLFSLGIILFLMLTGRKPFMGDTAAVMFKIVYEDPPLPSSIKSQLTPAYDYVSLKCLSKDRNYRYASARELLNDLDDLQNGRPLRSRAAAAVPSPPPRVPASPAQEEQTLVTSVPPLSASAPQINPVPSAPPPRRTPPPPPVATPATVVIPEPAWTAPSEPPAEGEVPIAPKGRTSAVAAVLGLLVVILLGAAGFGFWKHHQIMNAEVAPPQVALLPPPPVPPDLAPMEPLGAEQAGALNPELRKPQPATKPQAAATLSPAPPPQPTPVSELPLPQPVTPALSAEETARTVSPKVPNVARVVQVQCQYDLKEATFTFSGSGQAFFQDNVKGKKKGGFLGIKGAYEGTFGRTITVPAGVTEISLHVISKDGSTNLTKVVSMAPPGGFVPTLKVDIADNKIAMTWQSSSKPKP